MVQPPRMGPVMAAAEEEKDWQGKVNEFFGTYLLKPFDAVLFYDFGTEQWLGASVPLLVLWLLIPHLGLQPSIWLIPMG